MFLYFFFLISIILICSIAKPIFRFIKKVRYWSSMIDAIPGPVGIPFFGIALKFVTKREYLTKVGLELAAPFVGKCPVTRAWIGPFPFIMLLKAEAAKALLNSNKNIRKAILYRYFHGWIGQGLITSSGAKWQQRRKLVTPAFHFRILENFLPVMNEHSAILVQILNKKCFENNDFDIYPYITRCTLDIICATAMGQIVNAQVNTNCEYVNAVKNLEEVISKRVMKPWLAFDKIFYKTSLGKQYQRSANIVHEFTDKIINMKREQMKQNRGNVDCCDAIGGKRKVALLDLLLEHSMDNNNSGHTLTNQDIREEVDTFMFAGHDTTAVGFAWALYVLGQHKHIQHKIIAELNAVLGGDDEHVTMNDLCNLRYTECVIKECMRLFPPVPLFGRTLSEELEICGHKIPSGITVMVATYLIHRDPNCYPDPEKFNPDRFLPENSKDRDPFSYIPFSAGLRNCMGQKFAMIEFKVLMAWFFRKFTVISAKEPDVLTNISMELICRPIRGIRVKLEPIVKM